MFRYSFLLLLAVKAAATSYKECTQCEYVNQPKPFSRDFNIIADTSFDQSCVANEYTSFPYCTKKACNRQADNSYKIFYTIRAKDTWPRLVRTVEPMEGV